jgi:uncharacterized membrane protein
MAEKTVNEWIADSDERLALKEEFFAARYPLPTTRSTRYPELDLLRTLAIGCMVAYHAAYDLDAFYGWNIDATRGAWKIFQIGIGSLFLLLIGLSFAASARGRSPAVIRHRAARRFATLLAAAVIVSAATYVTDRDTYVRFGILHLAAFAALLLPFLRSMGAWNLLGGGLIVGGGLLIGRPTVSHPWLLWLGFPQSGFRSVDYYPLIPWLGAIAIGLGLGHLLYIRGWRGEPGPTSRAAALLGLPGRRSLFIYLAHQPIILALLWLILGQRMP